MIDLTTSVAPARSDLDLCVHERAAIHNVESLLVERRTLLNDMIDILRPANTVGVTLCGKYQSSDSPAVTAATRALVVETRQKLEANECALARWSVSVTKIVKADES